MDLHSLSGRTAYWAAVTGLWGVVAAAGCHSDAAGGRTPDAAVESRPDLMEKLPAPEANCPADAAGGGGDCPLNFCGQVKSVKLLQAEETATLGTDSLCTPGYVCVPDGATAAGTAVQLRCLPPVAGAAAFGQACVTGTNAGAHCKQDALCVAAPTAAKPTFCANSCRADYDCAADAFCLEYPSAPLPNGSYALLGFCTPKDKIDGTVCASEASCPADQGCVRYGGRTSLLVCRKVGGTKSLGAACAGPAECRSGECYDREFKLPATGKRTFCSGVCAKNSDCAADQRCVPSVLANNNTPADPFDDVVVGYCQTLFTPTAAGGCANDGACGGTQGDTCDVTHGLCYKKGTPIGAACANPNGSDNTGCDLGAVCVSGNGGYCQSTGCVAGAAAGVDACPGTTSVCSQRFADKPLGACYEKCATASDCSRFNQSYRCKAPTGDPGVPASICLFDTGV